MEASFAYGNSLYTTPRQAARAAVGDFMYGWNNSLADVAAMDPSETVAEIQECGWVVPGDWSHDDLVAMAAEISSEAKEAASKHG